MIFFCSRPNERCTSADTSGRAAASSKQHRTSHFSCSDPKWWTHQTVTRGTREDYKKNPGLFRRWEWREFWGWLIVTMNVAMWNGLRLYCLFIKIFCFNFGEGFFPSSNIHECDFWFFPPYLGLLYISLRRQSGVIHIFCYFVKNLTLTAYPVCKCAFVILI